MMDGTKNITDEPARLVAGTQSIGRAVDVLRLLAANPRRGSSLSEIIDGSSLLKPTCRRILLALIDAGLAEQDSQTRRYYLGPEAYVLGAIAAERFGIHRLALESVLTLARKTGDAAFLQVRRGHSVVCLCREDGDYPIRSHVLATGDRHPLGAGAGGLALLASMDDGDIEESLNANGKLLKEKYPSLPRMRLLDLVQETRIRGYSMNRGLLFPGSWGMGMVVRDARGQAEACLSLAAVESRLQPDREPQLAAWLAEEVRRVERQLSEFGSRNEEGPGSDLRALPPKRMMTRRAG